MQKEMYLEIIDHFGIDAQLDKLKEEVHEFEDAVVSGDKDAMEEEFADVLNVMTGFMFKFDLNSKKIMSIEVSKLIRTLQRIKEGFYDN